MIDEFEEIVGNQYVVLQRRIHRIFFRMTLDDSEVKNLFSSRISTILKFLLMSSSFCRWSILNRIDQFSELGITDLNSIFDLQILIAPSSSRGKDPCLSNAIILFEIGKLGVSFCVCSHGSMSIQILSEIGTLVGEDDEEQDGVDFGFAFAADFSALNREYSTILDSCPVLAEETSFSHGIRGFSVRSHTNLLSPFEILIHDWDLIPDQDVSCLQILTRGMTNDPKSTSLHK